MEVNRLKQNEDKLFNFNVKISIAGTPQLEDAINSKLQKIIEQYFLLNGEKISNLEIESINLYKQ